MKDRIALLGSATRNALPPENGLTVLTMMGPGGRLKWAIATLDPATLTTSKRRRRTRSGGAR